LGTDPCWTVPQIIPTREDIFHWCLFMFPRSNWHCIQSVLLLWLQLHCIRSFHVGYQYAWRVNDLTLPKCSILILIRLAFDLRFWNPLEPKLYIDDKRFSKNNRLKRGLVQSIYIWVDLP
jgi:hypothetical protein